MAAKTCHQPFEVDFDQHVVPLVVCQIATTLTVKVVRLCVHVDPHRQALVGMAVPEMQYRNSAQSQRLDLRGRNGPVCSFAIPFSLKAAWNVRRQLLIL